MSTSQPNPNNKLPYTCPKCGGTICLVTPCDEVKYKTINQLTGEPIKTIAYGSRAEVETSYVCWYYDSDNLAGCGWRASVKEVQAMNEPQNDYVVIASAIEWDDLELDDDMSITHFAIKLHRGAVPWLNFLKETADAIPAFTQWSNLEVPLSAHVQIAFFHHDLDDYDLLENENEIETTDDGKLILWREINTAEDCTTVLRGDDADALWQYACDEDSRDVETYMASVSGTGNECSIEFTARYKHEPGKIGTGEYFIKTLIEYFNQ